MAQSRIVGHGAIISTLSDSGDLYAPPGSRPWAIAIRLELQAAIRNREADTGNLKAYLRLIEQHKGYLALVDDHGRPFKSYRAFCQARSPYGLGYDPDVLEAIVAERKTVEARAAEAVPLTPHGEVGNGRSRGNNITSIRGDASDYLTARIARDRPDILERMKAGEFRSVYAAALEAGIVSPKLSIRLDDPTAAARSLRQKLSDDDIRALIAALHDILEAV